MVKIGLKEISTEIDFERFFPLFTKISGIDNLHNFINEQPAYPEWRETIQKMEFIRAVQGTVALEGSDLEVEDVERISDQTISSGSDQDKEAENALKAYEFIQDWTRDNPNGLITEAVIRQIHTIMTRDISYYLNEPGEYRNQVVEFGYPRKKSLLKDRFEVEEAMATLVNFINLEENGFKTYASNAITKALVSHYVMTFIHPFIDGNGRVSRALEALILHRYGKYESYFFPVTARFYYKERTQYFAFLRGVDESGDPFDFIEFGINGLFINLSEIKKHLLDQITRMIILDYAHQLRRQKRLLKRQINLLETMFYIDPMAQDQLYNYPAIRAIYDKLSESTRKRDFGKLMELGFLLSSEARSKEGKKIKIISVNWDVLKSVTIRLDHIPHRPY